MTTKQEIVAVRLQDEKGKSHHLNSKATPQRLVARLKCVESELFVYEGIRDHTLKIILAELYRDEDN